VNADAKMADGSFAVANAISMTDATTSTTVMNEAIDLDEMVCQSICAVENADLRKRLASSIILVGGVAKTERIVDWLEDCVFNRIHQAEFDESIECVEVLLVNLQQQQQVLLQQ
jgi:tRNA A37 threonylcarbamoyltransferase TsaD